MPTKLFDTVNLYDSSNAIDASPAEMLLIDVSTINDNVVVTVPDMASPVAMRPREGQCIGVMVYNSSISFQVTFGGPVLNAGSGFPALAELNAAILLTWDPDLLGGAWVMVSSNPIPAAPEALWLTPPGGTTPANGEFTIDSGSQTITLPEAPADGTFIAVKSTNGTTTVEASGADSIDQGDGTSGSTYLLPNAGAAAIFVYDGATSTWWIPGIYNTRPALTPTQETGNFTLTLGHLGQLIELTNPAVVTLPDQATVPWPKNAAFDFVDVQGGSTFIDGGDTEIKIPAGFLAEGAVAYARVRIEKLITTDEWVISGQLAV